MLDSLGIEYDLKVYPTKTIITSCHDPLNLDGRNMIKFFLDNPNLSEEEIEKVSSYLKNVGNIMKHDMALIITK